MTGLFSGLSGTATFGEGEDNETGLSSAGFRDIFVAEYDRNGGLLWAKRAGGVNDGTEAEGSRPTAVATAT